MGIDGHTQLIGLIGWPVGHSHSPAMHNAAAAALGLNWAYVALPVEPERLPAALRGLLALGFRGVNVTVPHKEAVLPLLDRLDPVAAAIGAVNTIVIDGDDLCGFNTDWSGFLADLAIQGVDPAGRDCLVLGAGGSARAIVYALMKAGGSVTVLARRVEQAQALVDGLAAGPGGVGAMVARLDDAAILAESMIRPLIINTTPLGLAGDQITRSPWPEGALFPADSFIYDLVYNPAMTRLRQQATAAGCRSAGGVGMLIYQAVDAFELWTGHRPDPAVMGRAINNHELEA